MLLAVVSVLVVWLKLNRHYDDNNPLCRIDRSAVAVVKINGAARFEDLVSRAEYGRHLNFTTLATVVDSSLSIVNGLIARGDVEGVSADKRVFYITVHALESDSADVVMLSMPLNSYMDGSELIGSLRTVEGISVEDTICDGNSLLKIVRGGQKLYACVDGGCLFVSGSQRQLIKTLGGTETALHDDPFFSTLERTSSESAQAAVFVNVGALDSVRLGYLPRMSQAAKWIEMDVDIDVKAISANGFLTSNIYGMCSAMADHKPMKFTADGIIPSYAKVFVSHCASQRGMLDESYVKHLIAINKLEEYRARVEKSLNETDIDVEGQLAQAFAGSVSEFSGSTDLADTLNTCVVIGAQNGTIAQGALNAAICATRKTDSPRQVEVMSPIPSLAVPVYEAFEDDADMFFVDDMLPYVPKRYYLRYENTLMLANNVEVLKRTLYETLLNRTFANDAGFRNLRQNFPSENTFFAYCTGGAMRDYVEQEKSGEFYGYGLQLSNLSGMPYVNVCGTYDPNRGESQPTSWQTKLDTTMTGRPYVVINHNTQEREYIVQDVDNKIYLINPQGLVLWTRKVDGPIVGRVQQIDYYCNKKLQYLFATKESVYLIDRNGNNTAKFPIQLPCEAVGGVTYMDYGNPLEFRIFVPCSDKQIVLYDKNCKKVEGWEMKHTEGLVRSEVDHWVSGNKDYLISRDNYSCYITDRRGRERVPLKPLAPNPNSRVYLVRANSDEAAFVVATADGKMASVDVESGETNSVKIDSIGVHPFYMFQLSNKEQFVFIDKERAVVTDDHGNVMSVEKLRLSDDIEVEMTNDDKLIVWDKGESLGYLMDATGKIEEGFPVRAKSMMAVSESGQQMNVVVAGEGQMLSNYIK